MKILERNFEQKLASTLQMSLFAIALDYGICFTNSQYREGDRFDFELSAFVNDDRQIMRFEVSAQITEEGERYTTQTVVFDCESKARAKTFEKEVFSKYEVIELVSNWVRTL